MHGWIVKNVQHGQNLSGIVINTILVLSNLCMATSQPCEKLASTSTDWKVYQCQISSNSLLFFRRPCWSSRKSGSISDTDKIWSRLCLSCTIKFSWKEDTKESGVIIWCFQSEGALVFGDEIMSLMTSWAEQDNFSNWQLACDWLKRQAVIG